MLVVLVVLVVGVCDDSDVTGDTCPLCGREASVRREACVCTDGDSEGGRVWSVHDGWAGDLSVPFVPFVPSVLFVRMLVCDARDCVPVVRVRRLPHVRVLPDTSESRSVILHGDLACARVCVCGRRHELLRLTLRVLRLGSGAVRVG